MSRGICLVIEDDEDIAGLIGLILTREGFDVRSVRTASAALHQIRGLNPALIALDLGLPDLDGLQIAKALRELSAAPLLMITARASARGALDLPTRGTLGHFGSSGAVDR
jgi:two-component system OmpR family response regulator